MPALQLIPAQRSELRSRAHGLNPVVMIGAEGLTPAVLAEIDRSLAAHDLIKIRVFGDEREARIAIYEAICEALDAAPIQHIGKLLVVWRPGPARLKENQPGELPRQAQRKGSAPRTVTVRKPSAAPNRRPTRKQVTVLGNERVTAGGNVKRARQRPASQKKKALG
ncbi:RNA-binding protein [Cupriavidus sp. USMAA2-4]|uniref:RNA-binding protein n=1 Tax=Cupriavidus malaysiensis TaxID=367825 RepID=A0ABN4TR17_9BURK|nr:MULTISPECIES: YhbY family RNA-binding protein [Cupriavidus]AOY93456.1 RNA-binding protein [Cupriavidus sp. USMAA2-4]AOZ00266.1 RNA-binding protein [Cupriavidus sp. USMAHM13]AOZ07011.1 RNA-binding protein [Cupriavidus malaysiensis]